MCFLKTPNLINANIIRKTSRIRQDIRLLRASLIQMPPMTSLSVAHIAQSARSYNEIDSK